MLSLVETPSDKRQAQSLLEKKLTALLERQGKLNVGFPGGNVYVSVYANGGYPLWAAFVRPDQGSANPRFWNAFGVFDPNAKSQTIAVEINISVESNSAQVAGFVAKDEETGDFLLMHSGKIGGGRKGIGRTAYLVWSKSRLVAVQGEHSTRFGIPIANLNRDNVAERIWRFVELVNEFKEAAVSGDLKTAEFRKRVDRYAREFSGLKCHSHKLEIEYLTYHGDVVDALYKERCNGKLDDELVANSILVDLYVERGGRWTEVYEVKSSADRQAIYTAIGQLLTHGRACDKTLVLPKNANLPKDLQTALEELDVAVRYFTFHKTTKGRRVELEK